MFFMNESPLEDFFPEESNVLEIGEPSPFTNKTNDRQRQYFEFIPFHPVSATSEMVGTTIEELLQHNFPTKNSWENSRFARYPEEIVIRLNHRSEVRFVLIRAKCLPSYLLIEFSFTFFIKYFCFNIDDTLSFNGESYIKRL